MSTAGIAAALSVSVNTVKSHLRSVFWKCGVHDRRAAVCAITGALPVPPHGVLPPPAVTAPISPRQRDVLAAAALGFTPREIASELFIGRNTVKSHLMRAYRRLGVHSLGDALTAAAMHELSEKAGWQTGARRTDGVGQVMLAMGQGVKASMTAPKRSTAPGSPRSGRLTIAVCAPPRAIPRNRAT